MGYHGDMMVFFNMTDSYCQYHMRQYEWLGVGVDSMEWYELLVGFVEC